MLSRWLVSCSVALLVFAAVLPIVAQLDSNARTERARRYLARLGTGKDVVVTVDNGSKVNGNVLSIGNGSFEVRSTDHSRSTTIAFSDVKEIKRPELSRRVKIGILVAGLAEVLLVIAESIPVGSGFH